VIESWSDCHTEWSRERSCVGRTFCRMVRRPRRDHICDRNSMDDVEAELAALLLASTRVLEWFFTLHSCAVSV
jgi:hypothetical protein